MTSPIATPALTESKSSAKRGFTSSSLGFSIITASYLTIFNTMSSKSPRLYVVRAPSTTPFLRGSLPQKLEPHGVPGDFAQRNERGLLGGPDALFARIPLVHHPTNVARHRLTTIAM